jgi:hypothetical protein
MRIKLLAAAAAGITALALGAGIGMAAAQDSDPVPGGPGGFGTMAEMHASMRDRMPDDVAQACDEMHASMMGRAMMDEDSPRHAEWHARHQPARGG